MSPLQLFARRLAQQTIPSSSYIGVVSVRKLHESSLPAGAGGRSSFSGISATVFGGTGALGRRVVGRLGRVGSGIVLPYRLTETAEMINMVASDLGQLQQRPFNIKQSDDEIRKLIEYSNGVVNVIGCMGDVNLYTSEEVNYEWPVRLARLVAEKNDGTKLVQISNLNCHQEQGRKVSKLLDQKYRAEVAMREIYPDTIIVRSAGVFGTFSQYLDFFLARAFEKDLGLLFSLPLLYDAGRSTVVRPCYDGDVAEAVVRILKHIDSPGKTFELVGPKAYLLKDFVEHVRLSTGKKSYIYNTLGPLDGQGNLLQKAAQLVVQHYFSRMDKPSLFGFMPHFLDTAFRKITTKYQWATLDYFNQVHISDVTTGCRGFEDLGIEPLVYEDKMYKYLSGMNTNFRNIEDYFGIRDLPPPPSVDENRIPKPSSLATI